MTNETSADSVPTSARGRGRSAQSGRGTVPGRRTDPERRTAPGRTGPGRRQCEVCHKDYSRSYFPQHRCRPEQSQAEPKQTLSSPGQHNQEQNNYPNDSEVEDDDLVDNLDVNRILQEVQNLDLTIHESMEHDNFNNENDLCCNKFF